MKLKCRVCGFINVPPLTVPFLLKCALLFEIALSSRYDGSSYSLLRRPRLVLRHYARDLGATLHFFNADTLTIYGNIEDAVNCTVSGGHLREVDGVLHRVTSVSVRSLPVTEKWHAPKDFLYDSSDTLQTRTSFNVSYDVEGNLTCRDTLGMGLTSNTILLRYKDRESVVVRLRGSSKRNPSESYKVLRNVHQLYGNVTYLKQEGKLVELHLLPEPEAVIRVSYYSESGIFDQNKLYTAVKEATRYIAKTNELRVKYIRSTRYCLPVEEGNFTWPMTLAGLTTVPENPCVDEDNTPLPRRHCLGDFFNGVFWNKLPQRPHLCLNASMRSTRLLNLMKSFMKSDLLGTLAEEIVDGKPLSPVEIYFAAEALRKTAERIHKTPHDISTPNMSTVVTLMSAILKSGRSTIKSADDSYGSSEIILESVVELVVSAASPMPIPVSTQYFSAFASQAGTGIQGFAFIPRKKNISEGGRDQMVTFDRKNPLHKVLKRGPSVVAYLDNQPEDYSIISTLFEDDSLFSAAEYPGMRLEGPVFGMKLFQKGGEELEEMRPIPLSIRFLHNSSKDFGMQCVSWEPSRIDGWSNSGCIISLASRNVTVCICTILTSLDMYFTIVRDNSTDDTKTTLFKLLPLKMNDGALLTVFRSVLNGSSFLQEPESVLSCSVAWGNSDWTSPMIVNSSNAAHLQLISNITFNDQHPMLFFNVSSTLEGFLQCRDTLGHDLLSNEILTIKPNSASVRFSGKNLSQKSRNIHDFFKTKYLSFNYSSLSIESSNGSVIVRVTQVSEKNHSDFISSLSRFSHELAKTYDLPLMDIRSNRYCLQENEDGFIWPTTKLGHFSTPTNPCIDSFGAPTPIRKCIGGYASGVFWDVIPQRPDPCNEPSKRAQRLKNLSVKVVEKDIFKELLDSVKEETVLSVIETNNFKRTLKNLAEEVSKPNSDVPKPNITTVASIVNAVIDIDSKVIHKTEEMQVTMLSDTLLDSIDKLLEKASTPTVVPVITPHFSAAAISPGTKIKGFMTHGKDIKPVVQNQTILDVIDLAPKVGAFLVDAPQEVGITYTNFQNSTLFSAHNETENSRVVSPIIGLNVFGNEEESPTNMMVFLLFSHEPGAKSQHHHCHYWDTERREWSREGCAHVPPCDLPSGLPQDVDACLCTHLTHFAMLISEAGGSFSEDYFLHIITIVGCSISTISLIGIFFISVVYPQWSRGASRKVQLNLSASLTLLMTAYLAIAFQGECPISKEVCISLGIILHYSVLSAFCWMLVVAFLQLMRLTRSIALGARQQAGTHLVLRTSVFGWGMPIVPVAATLVAGTDMYVRLPNSALCYPRGRAFYAGVLFPIAFIVIVNTFIFSWLIHSLFCNKFQDMRVHQRDQWRRALRRFYAAMFLFCLLGISWLSGVFIELTMGSEIIVKVLSYVFCITATLQGTSLFIFFVACERKVGERLSRAATIFSRKGSSIDTKVHYMAKTDSVTSEKATDSTNPSTVERCKSSKTNAA